MKRFLVLIVMLGAMPWLRSQDAGDEAKGTLGHARKFGWGICKTIMQGAGDVKSFDGKEFPGNATWFTELHKAMEGVASNKPVSLWPVVDSDKLVTRNPRYWQAHFEIAPADPSLALLQASLLQMGGATQRSSYHLVIAAQAPEIDADMHLMMLTMVNENNATISQAYAMTKKGIALHDKGDYAGAVAQYDQVLKAYPCYGLVYYERGYSLRMKAWKEAGYDERAPQKEGQKPGQKLPEDSEEVIEMYAKARRHDPFQMPAYQGSNREVIDGFIVLSKTGQPAWKKLEQAFVGRKQVENTVMEELAEALQKAGAHDLALAARQVLVARRGGYAPEDYPFLAKSLKALAMGEPIATTLSILKGKEPMKVRQLTKQSKPANQVGPQDKFEPKVANTDHVVLLIPTTEIAQRVVSVETFSDYIKRVMKKVDEIMLTVKETDVKAKGLVVVMGIKADKKTRIWCEAIDGEIPEALLRQLEKEVGQVEGCDLNKPPVAVMLNMKLWGRVPEKFEKLPKTWLESAKKHDVKIVIPPDELFKHIWRE